MRSIIITALAATAGFYSLRGVHGLIQRTTLDNTTPRLQLQQGLPAASSNTFYRQNHAGNGRPTEFFAP